MKWVLQASLLGYEIKGGMRQILLLILFRVLAAADPCVDSLWRHVYHPGRLIVVHPCIGVTGVIVDATDGKSEKGVRREHDGDIHGWLRVDPKFRRLLSPGNFSHQDGYLVFEIICMYRPSQPDAISACGHPSSSVTLPPVGTHVLVVGSYVQDTIHGHMEIHPVTSITVQ
jgi:hypothetical protein